MSTFRVPAKIAYAADGGPGVNVWHIRTVDDDTDLGDALTALTSFYNDIKGIYVTGTTITIGESMIKDPYGAPTYQADDVTVVTGTGGVSALSPLLCINTAWRTPSATRSGRGRTFLGPLSDATIQGDGTPGAAYIGTVLAAAQGLVAASQSANGWAVGVYSQKQNLLRDITGVSVRDRYTFLSSRRAN